MPLFEGDLVIHFLGSMFESENGGIGDFWVMTGGENFTITSNESDFPPGFELHPTEVSDGMTYRMERLRSGWRPGEIVTAPNIWRVKEGDRVLLLGERSWLPGVNSAPSLSSPNVHSCSGRPHRCKCLFRLRAWVQSPACTMRKG